MLISKFRRIGGELGHKMQLIEFPVEGNLRRRGRRRRECAAAACKEGELRRRRQLQGSDTHGLGRKRTVDSFRQFSFFRQFRH
jgi:hypothetical protein